jgi:hypothetical protein
MKKQTWLSTLVLTLIMAVGFSAHADVSGVWRGTGQWTYQGSGTDCIMGIHYEETATALKRIKGHFNCDVVALYSDPITWSKQGTDLILDGKKAGSIGPQGFEATEGYGDEGVTITTKFVIGRPGHAEYLETWREKNGTEIYVIRGKFQK